MKLIIANSEDTEDGNNKTKPKTIIWTKENLENLNDLNVPILRKMTSIMNDLGILDVPNKRTLKRIEDYPKKSSFPKTGRLYEGVLHDFKEKLSENKELEELIDEIIKNYNSCKNIGKIKVNNKRSERIKEHWSDPENKKKQSERKKEYWSDPEQRKKLTDIYIEYWNRPENKDKLSKMSRQYWSNSENKKRMSEIIKQAWDDPEIRKKYELNGEIFKEKINKHWNDPEIKKKWNDKLKEFFLRPENQGYTNYEHNKKFLDEWWSDQENRNKLAEYLRGKRDGRKEHWKRKNGKNKLSEN